VCQDKKAARKAGKYTPMCSDGKFATCPNGYESYSKSPPCISQDGKDRQPRICEDGTPAVDCKRNKKHSLCPGWGKNKQGPQGRRYKCADEQKPTCPAGYSSGECVDESGNRSRARCDFTDKKIKPIKCNKEPNNTEVCAGKTGPICENTKAPPTCKDGSKLDFEPYKTPLDVQPQALVLSQHRRPPHPPHGPKRPHRRPLRNGPGKVVVDYLCLKVELN